MQLTLIVEPDLQRDLGLRDAAGEQRLRQADAAMRDVRVRRQPHVVGRPVTEDDAPVSSSDIPRAASEEAASAAAERGVRVAVMRLPQVHDTRRAGLVSYLIATARQKGFVAYVGDGQNQWPAAHVADVAPLYRLVLEKAGRFARYHAVAEEGVGARAMADVLGTGLRMPVRSIAPGEAGAYFGWMAHFAAADMRASSAKTRSALGWQPAGPTMLEDLQKLEWV